MVLKIAYTVLTAILPSKYYTHVVLVILGLLTIYTYAQGRKTNRERDLHGRTILITGAFTPLGLTLLDSLAQRGAHIIALSPDLVDLPEGNSIVTSASLLIPVLRSTTNNENIYAEHCDLSSPASIRAFCVNFLKGEEKRLDAIIFAHEYPHIGSVLPTKPARNAEKERQAASCATFLLITLLLPALLTAPVERDIRLIALINPFYAAAAPSFSTSVVSSSETPTSPSPAQSALFLTEGHRALCTTILMRHLQRVLDALPTGAQLPRADTNSQSVPVVNDKVQRSNIVAVSVSPGVSRADIIAPLLGADTSRKGVSLRGMLLYFIMNPLLRIFTKSSFSAIQGVLHTLFLPTPFKHLAASAPGEPGENHNEEEVLKPGALYTECAVAKLHVPPAPAAPENDSDHSPSSTGKDNVGGEAEEAGSNRRRADDGDLGGEALGTLVWDEYERELKKWEAQELEEQKEMKQEEDKREKSRDGRHTPPTVDTPSE
ncbi:hypothetical protein EW146_g885 [Bondarzewia mesenterica]|uniref:Ketoreductase (KR) domain-containing protein n=1 Tax=Bondarzewia mesenterica TaxID=1095465 RepID=A0A4S4M7T6_9AGAM|nr:hypothetical protein EW146_g885 [Bondarzewia mesenterica]